MSGRQMTDDDRAEIYHLVKEQGYSLVAAAKETGFCRQTVAKYLSTLKATGAVARAYAESQALTLTTRVIKDADVDQSLEVLDRLDVLPKKRDAGVAGQHQFIVCVGMPGSPAITPPDQGQIVTVQQRVLAEKAHE